jgi:hypothetical protein
MDLQLGCSLRDIILHADEEKNGHRAILAQFNIDVGPTWKKFDRLMGKEVSFAWQQYLVHSSCRTRQNMYLL